MSALEEFVGEHGRLPSSAVPEEGALYKWMWRRRRDPSILPAQLRARLEDVIRFGSRTNDQEPIVATDDILDKVLVDLAAHPGSTAREIAQRIGTHDDRRVFMELDGAAYDGKCQRWRPGLGAWRWEVTPDGHKLT